MLRNNGFIVENESDSYNKTVALHGTLNRPDGIRINKNVRISWERDLYQ